jgi:hypothetical protein
MGVCAAVVVLVEMASRLDSNGAPETGCGAVLAAIANPVNAANAIRFRVFIALLC